MTALPEDRSSVPGEDDRDTAVRRRQEAYAEEHIAHGDPDERLHQVLTVRTHSELLSPPAWLPQQNAGLTSTIAAAGGRIRRRGVWRVPRSLRVGSAFGRVRLDLSRAVTEHSVVDIELRLGAGGARITLPRDAVVDVVGPHTGWKDSRYKPRPHSCPGGPRMTTPGPRASDGRGSATRGVDRGTPAGRRVRGRRVTVYGRRP